MTSFHKTSSKTLIQNSLPHNFLAEKQILSCLIRNGETLELVKQNLIVEAFYFKNHQKLYQSLLDMEENNFPIDILTVAGFLQNRGIISKIGGIKVLLDLVNQSITFSYLTEYIQIVKEKFLKRCLIKFGYKVIHSGYITSGSLETNLTKMERELFQLTNEIRTVPTANTAQVLNDLFAELKEKILNPKLPGLSSGFSQLDELTQGFQKSDLIIIAGRPSMGKTALSLNIALNCIKLSYLPILFCSLEMSKEQILYRLLSSETGINQMKLRSGKLTQNDWVKLNKVIRIISKLPFFIDDTSNLSTQNIRSRIKTILLEQSQIGLIVIDYIQLLQPPTSKQMNRVQELSQITRELKSLAREFNVPIIALSQLSRNVDNRINQRPILSDLRESGSIEQDADLILMLSGSKGMPSPNSLPISTSTVNSVTELIIAKQRNGPIGTIKLNLNEDRIQFLELKTNDGQ
uniref:Replicative DNA helicase n=1 Tax=Kryptoperidinium foliaceum TaxID=160619 RepID=D7PJD7_9DINO|nr:DNA replication helicase [Kryptoperidinium foliaceum]ADI40337.1 DNA replication helicase [Kryptoperidinium foliaceum]